jgi:NitT/TauT family transport system substrate-binding protein
MKKRNTVLVTIAVIMALGIGLWFFAGPGNRYTGKSEPITVGWSPWEHSALFYVAEDQGYFGQNGLKVTSREYDFPATGLDGMLKGEVDVVVGSAEWPLVRRVFAKKPLCVIGNIDKSELAYLIGRKDRGINEVADLAGKRVGVTFGTISEFYLGRLLDLNSVPQKDVTPVDIKLLAEYESALVNGQVDALVMGEPSVTSIRKKLGANVTILPAQSSHPQFALVVSTDTWVAKNPGAAIKFLRSLAQAEEYVLRNPEKALLIIQRRLNLDDAYMKTVWSQNQFGLSLDQSLIAAMEDEGRWLIQSNLAPEKQMPDFLDYIDERALKEAKPAVVNIIR